MGLKDKLEALKNAGGEPPWEEVVQEWKDAIVSLIASVKEWLAEYEAAGLLTFHEETRMLHEERLPVYEAPCLRIETPSPEILIYLEPHARIVFGGMGRVDLFLAAHREDGFMLLRRLGDKNEMYWSLRRDYGEKGVLSREFDKAALEGVIESWLP